MFYHKNLDPDFDKALDESVFYSRCYKKYHPQTVLKCYWAFLENTVTVIQYLQQDIY